MLFQKIRKVSWEAFFHPDANTLDQDNYLKIITALYAFSGYLLVVWFLIILRIYWQTSVLYFLVLQCEQPPEEFLKAAVALSCKLLSATNSGLASRTAVLRISAEGCHLLAGVAQEHPSEFRTTVGTLPTSQPCVYKVAHPCSLCVVWSGWSFARLGPNAPRWYRL